MVSLRNLTKRFGSFTAVDDVTLDIRAGEFLTLLGPSGCGKTTLLRMIAGFERPNAGAVFLQGQDVTSLPPYRRDVNQVFQSYALFPHLCVRDNIAFGLRMRRMPRATINEKVAAAVDLVSLAGMESRKPHQLSGGQRQRVALARALVCEPKVLLLDEPLAALDAKLRRSMQVELKRLQHRVGITFVFVTHDQEEALTMSNRIAVMNHGRIEQLGDVADVYHRPRTAFVAAFLGHANLISGRVVAREAAGARVVLADGTILLASADAPDDEVLVSIRPEKLIITRVLLQGENVLEAEVKETIFKGAFTQTLVGTTGGVELTALIAHTPGESPPREGDRVFCQLHRDDLVLLPRPVLDRNSP
jgi:spermidine/putrescine transport system ATP-binding protein